MKQPSKILSANAGETVVSIKTPSVRYLDEFIGLNCAVDLLKLRAFPNAKEVTESMAAFNAIRKYTRKEKLFTNPKILMLDVGSGKLPRTAALFAFMTKWMVTAIDPALDQKAMSEWNIQRLAGCREKIENYFSRPWVHTLVVTAVHAHIDLSEILEIGQACIRILIVAIPCCKPLELKEFKPVWEYDDWGILSPKRRVKIYDINL